MTESRTQRKLAAILYADVEGYSRLTGEDEVGTHSTLSERLDAFAAAIQRRGGRVGHFAGDAVLAEFASVVEALSCAVEVQRDFVSRNEHIPEHRRVQFRIGINLGDVIADRGEVYGDGVNVAARLETLAEPNGICISESAHLAIGNKLPLSYDDIGARTVKNIANPVRAYRVVVPAGTVLPNANLQRSEAESKLPQPNRRWLILTAVFAVVLAVLVGFVWLAGDIQESDMSENVREPLSDTPSVIVLPFDNLSGDPDQEYFADGISDDLITDLSQISSLFVVARHSAFAYKERAVDIQQIGRELGVRYVLEGSVRKAGDRIRINAQLTDTDTGGHLWAARYDSQLQDIFDLQDEVTGKIVAALEIELTEKEQDLLARRYTEVPEAYDFFLRGQEHYFRLTAENNIRARELYRRAIELDPDFGRASGALAVTFGREALYGWSDYPQESLEQALKFAQRAVTLNADVPQAHWALGFTYLLMKQHDRAATAIEQAIVVDPTFADGYALLGWINSFSGNPERALVLMDKALALSPQAGALFLSVLAHAQYWAGHFEESVLTSQNILEINPNLIDGHLYLAAALSRLGRPEEAEWEVQEVLALNPAFTLQELERRTPIKDPRQLELLVNDLRQAGLP